MLHPEDNRMTTGDIELSRTDSGNLQVTITLWTPREEDYRNVNALLTGQLTWGEVSQAFGAFRDLGDGFTVREEDGPIIINAIVKDDTFLPDGLFGEWPFSAHEEDDE